MLAVVHDSLARAQRDFTGVGDGMGWADRAKEGLRRGETVTVRPVRLSVDGASATSIDFHAESAEVQTRGAERIGFSANAS
jgi:hypothetical protein